MITEVIDESIDWMNSKLWVVAGKNWASALWTSKIQSIIHGILLTTGIRTFLKALGSLTFLRFGISKYDQYSIFRITFQYHWTMFTETRSSRIDGC